ncbi:Ig-like domain-containing protein [Bradyrhizobium stylosanthis]|uniref:Ig-like domain-containing protein n=1 Tax=Bradyrhizobium stylosanthis TaxID=1803665 RepID=UPI001ABF2D14|nr:Ig-like domain-containing protein [Bradyrhizobium stylosanthis]
MAYEVSTDGGTTWAATTSSQGDLVDGSYQFRATVTDAAGNSATSNTISVVVDNTAPVAGTLAFSGLDDTGSANAPAVTKDGSFDLSLTGTSDANSTSVAYEVSTDGGNTWGSTTSAQDNLADGSYQFRATVTDAAGNNATSNTISVVVDNTAPTAGTLSFSGLDDTGSANTPAVTKDGSFDLSLTGTSDANATSVAYEVSTDGGTTWAATSSAQSDLADGNYQFRATVTDAAGNSATSNTISVVVDDTAPTAGTLAFSGLDDTGSANTPAVTKDGSFDLSLTGTSDANSTSVAYEVSTDGGNTWGSTTSAQDNLADGSYQFRATVTDAAGNSATSNTISVVVDNTAPVAGTLAFSGLDDTGSANTPAVTKDGSFDLGLTGSSDANSTSVAYEVSTDGGTTWAATTSSQGDLVDGSYQFRATVTDAAGNSATSNTISVVVDNTAPVAGTLAFSGLDDTGSANTPAVTKDGSFDLSLTGTSDTNSTSVAYEVSTDGGTTWGSTTSAQSDLSDGSYQFRATVTDAAGNSATSNTISVVVDNTAPAAGTLAFSGLDDTGSANTPAVTKDGSFDLSLTGTSDANATSVAYEVSTDGGTTWAATSSAQSDLADGNYQFRATVTDAAGNSATSNTISVVVDDTAPVAGTLAFSGLDDTGSANTPAVTKDGSFDLSLTGSSDANATSVAYEVSTDGGTTWASTSSAQSDLDDGSYQFRATVTDAAGNSATSNTIAVVIDNTAPVAGTLAFSGLDDTGSPNTPAVTKDGSFDLSLTGSSDVNATSIAYEVSTDGGANWAATAAAQDNLADGSYQFRATITDAAGNTATSNTIAVVVDNTAPVAGTLAFSGLDDTGSANAPAVTKDGNFDLSLTGSSDANATSVAYEVSTDGGNTWGSTSSAQIDLTDGSYQFRATVTDAAGNSATSNTIAVVVDNTAPAAGTLAFSDLDDTGSANTPAVTKDGSFDLSLTGTSDANATSVAYEVSTDGGSTWAATTAAQSDLDDGSYQFRATVTDAAGNSATSNTISVVVDNTAPVAGTLAFSGLDDTGSANTPAVTKDGSFDLSLTGTSDASATSVAYEVSIDGGTTWAATSSAQSDLADGSYQFRATVTDAAGNSATSNTISVVVDNTAPVAGTLAFSGLDDTGSANTPAVTKDGSFDLSLTGTSDANATSVAYEVSTDGGTTWAATSSAQSDLADGSYQFRATVTDAAGNSATSNTISVVVDNTAPTEGTLAFSGLDDTGSANTPAVTKDGSFDLSLTGSSDANATSVAYEVSTDGGTTWAATSSAQGDLADGSYQFRAMVTDAAGNSATSNTISVVVDNTAPTAGTLSLSGYTDSGASSTDFNSTDKTFDLTLTGIADTNTTSVVYEVSTDGGLSWAATTAGQSDLADGSYQFRATVTDAAGNNATSNTIAVVVDNTAPTAGTLAFSGLDDTGSTNTPAITKDGSFDLSLTGSSDANATSVAYEVSTDGGTTWAATTSAQDDLADGSYQFRATVTDAAGNSATSNTISVVVDNTAPVAGTLSFSGLDDTGSANTPAITKDGSFDLSLSGTSDANATSVAYEVSTDGGLSWTATDAAQGDLADGSYQFRATVTDAAGNSATSNTIAVVVDNTAPTAGTLSFSGLDDTGSPNTPAVTKDGSFDLSLTGTSDANATSVAYEVSTDGGNTWAATTTAQDDLVDGSYQFRATTTDAAGNSATSNTISVVVDNTAPVAGTLAFSSLDDTGSTNTPAVTKDGSFDLSLTGTSDVNATGVAYEVSTDGGTTWAATTAGQSDLADGSYQFRATVTDDAGNSATSNTISVIVDNTAPTAGTLALSGYTDSGSSSTDFNSTDKTFDLTLTGNADTNATSIAYEVSIDGGNTWASTSSAQGDLADGSYQFRATTTDAAGNTATSNTIAVVVDNTAPVAGTLAFSGLDDTGTANAPAVTKDGSFDLSLTGTSDANATSVAYEVSTDGGLSWASATSAQSDLADGSYQFRATVTDAAGNSATSNTISVVVDNTAPTAGTLAFSGLDDTGSANTPAVTKDGSFDLSLTGTSDINATSVGYEVSTDGGTWAATTSAQDDLADGNYQFRATVTDAAGNSATSNTISVVVDNTAPTAGTLAFSGLDDTGSTDSPAITKDGSFDLSLTGTSDVNATSVAYEVSTDGGTTWASTSSAQGDLADGSYQFRATVTDAAGNSATSNTISVVVDNTAPTAGTLAFSGLDDTGSTNTPAVTKDGSFDLSLTGTSDANATSVAYEVSTDGGTTWGSTSSAQSDLADGSYQFRATVTDAASNSATSNTISVVVDNTAPVAGTLSFSGLDDTGNTNTPAVTKDGSFDLSLTGTSDINATSVAYEVSADGGTTWGSTTSAQSDLSDGSYQFRATVTDAAGNSATSNTISVVVDNTAPVAGTWAFSGLDDTGSANAPAITKDGSFDLSLTGTSDANATNVTYEVSADGGASWSSTTSAQDNLADGSYQFRATVADAAGNSATSNTISVVIDNTAPTAGTLAFSGLDDTGSANTPAVTKDGSFDLSLTGTSDANATSVAYEVSTDGGLSWTATDGAQGDLADGSYQFRATVTDAAGNSATSNTISVVVDNTAPTAGTLAFSGLDDTGSPNTPAVTKDGSFDLSLTGSSDANATSVAYEVSTDGGTTWAATTSAQDDLADGSYQFRATVTDAAGNSATSNTISVVVDNTAPTAGTLSFSGLDDTGSANTPAVTKDGSFDLSLTGSSDANATSVAYEVSTDGGTTWGSTTSAQDNLADGSYQFRATTTDAAGNTATSNAISVVVDNTAPTAGTLAFSGFDDTGSTNTPAVTKDGSFDLSLTGSSDANATSVAYEVSTDSGTTWTSTTSAQDDLADGSYQFRATVTDAAGNSATSNTISVVVDNTAPVAPVITGFADNSGSGSDSLTNDQTPTLTISAEAGATVEVFRDGVSVGLATESATPGTYTFTSTSLGDGTYGFTATATDAAANTSVSSADFDLTIDHTAPNAPVIAGFADNSGSGSDSLTNDQTPTLTITAEAGATVEVFQDGVSVGLATETATPGTYTFTSTSLNDGTYGFTAKATDAAANTGPSSTEFDITVDHTAPSVAIALSDNSLTIGETQTVTFTFSEVPVNFTLADVTYDTSNGSLADLTQDLGADPSGKTWTATFTPNPGVLDNTNTFTVGTNWQDPAGNPPTGNSVSDNFTINTADTTSPTVTVTIDDTIINASETTTVHFTFSEEVAGFDPSSSGNVTVVGGTLSAFQELDSSHWTATFTPSPGTQTNTASVNVVDHSYTDLAGNPGGAGSTGAFTVDSVAPTAPSITSAVDDVAPILGNVANGGTTNDTSLVLNGTAEANTTIAIYDGANLLNTVTTAGNGQWTYTATGLSEGGHNFTATATDAAGNISPTSTAYGLTVDTIAPVAGALAFAGLNDSGSANTPPVTQDNAFTLNLADQEAGTTVVYQVSLNGGGWTTTTSSQSGLADGDYQFQAIVTDAAGNSSTTSTIEVVVDNTAPVAGTLAITGFIDTGTSNTPPVTQDNTFSLAISGQEAGTTTVYQVSLNGGGWTNTTASQTGLTDGHYQFQAIVTDAAGNTSISNAIEVVIDNTAPAAGTLSFANLTDTGTADSPPVTQDNNFNLNLSGQEAGTSVAYQVSTNGGTSWSATTNAQTGLADGNYQFRAVVTDAAGNNATSNAIVVTVDNSGPAAGTLSFTNLADTGTANSPPVTQDNNFNLNLSGQEAGTSVAYQVSTNGGTSWSATTSAQTNLGDGDYQFRAVVTDAAGNSATSNAVAVTVDNSAPAAGTLSFANLTDTGTANSPPVTQDNNFNLNLSGQEAGTTVVYQVSTNGGTSWSTTSSTQTSLADGNYQFRAVVTDAAGNSATSNAIAVTVDNSAPAAGTLSFTNLTDTGPANSPPVTQDNSFNLNLSGQEAGTTVAYQVSTNGGTSWSATSSTQTSLADGNYQFRAVVTDAAGNNATSNAIVVTVDNSAPAAGTLSFTNLTDTGTANSPPVTQDNSFNLNLSGQEAGTTVAYQLSTNGGTSWSATTSTQAGLGDGDYLFRAVVTDAAGNSSTGNVIEVIVDNTAPTAALAITAISNDTGISATDFITNDTTLTVSGTHGTLGSGEKIQISTNGGSTWIDVTSTTATTWSYVDAVVHTSSFTYQVRIVDAAGNVDPNVATQAISIDTAAPNKPTITSAADDVAPQTGNVASGGSTNDTNLLLSGAGEAGTTITLYEGASILGTTTVAANGLWSLATGTLSEGLHSFTVIDTDKAGNASAASSPYSVTVDLHAPILSATSEVLSGNGKLTLTGVSDTAGTVSITDNGSALGTATASGGSWSFTTGPKFADILHTLGITQTDAAGNVGSTVAIFGSSGNDNVTTGSNGADLIATGAGNDTINGFVGADKIDGGTGADTIALTATSADLNNATDGQIVNVEAVSAASATSGVNIDLHNQSEGFAITGSSLADVIIGGAGGDRIIGGGQGDTLTGGPGSDTFVYNATSDSKPGAGNFDTILGFAHGADKIDFSAITGLTAVASATSAPAQIAAHTIEIVTSGGNTIIYANATNSAQNLSAVDMEIHLTGVANLTASDILHH